LVQLRGSVRDFSYIMPVKSTVTQIDRQTDRRY